MKTVIDKTSHSSDSLPLNCVDTMGISDHVREVDVRESTVISAAPMSLRLRPSSPVMAGFTALQFATAHVQHM